MTKVNFVNGNKGLNFPLFKDLEVGEYFFDNVNNWLYFKLPFIITQDDKGVTYNAYNLTTKSLVFVGDKVSCIPVKEIDICIK